MAGESTYGSMSTLIGNVYDIALQAARDMNIMAPLVTTWTNLGDSRPRLWSTYTGGTYATTDENTDLSAQAFVASVAGTATPAVYAQQAVLTQRRLNTDPMSAQQEAGKHLGETAATFIDTALCGTAIFGALTAGTVGTAGSTATWANIFRAQAYLRTAKVHGNVFCVLHPVQWYYLVSGTSGVPTLVQNEYMSQNILTGGQYVGSFGNINFVLDANIVSGTAAVGAMFAPQAMYLDVRTPFTINPQYDASRTGSGAWELNAFMELTYGVYRPTFGCQIIGTSA